MIATSNETSLKELVTTKIYPTFEGSAALRSLLLPQHKRSMFLLDLGDMLTFCAITTCPRVPSLLAQSAAAAGVLAGEGVEDGEEVENVDGAVAGAGVDINVLEGAGAEITGEAG